MVLQLRSANWRANLFCDVQYYKRQTHGHVCRYPTKVLAIAINSAGDGQLMVKLPRDMIDSHKTDEVTKNIVY